MQEKIRSIVPNAEIILYGSRVRGEASKNSDWDLLILVDQPVDHNLTMELRDSLYEIELETDEILSCIVRSKQDWYSGKYSVLPFKRLIDQEGVRL
ncbi:nucleotidyltransferase domain-containing protein [candidate division KSB1 bacterium]|nr:nucleotidyltransferase domain-containing protein [candidate division KSB1 bacterium]NIW22489.1 nucleotidyltransferase domain-containing protein [candidate division KSB1 bacterium]NIW73127.1 nucleotidyltransferase domain-containing protein [candidate division KSB1 bacterium]